MRGQRAPLVVVRAFGNLAASSDHNFDTTFLDHLNQHGFKRNIKWDSSQLAIIAPGDVQSSLEPDHHLAEGPSMASFC